MSGIWCHLEPIDSKRHGGALFEAFSDDTEHRIWSYLPYGPFENAVELTRWIENTCLGSDPLFHVIVDELSHKAVGVASYLRVSPAVGVIEVGHINYAPMLQKTRAGTEAMYLMMKRVFEELGYRRYEWKCDALNTASRQAAERLGMTFEGVFRQATIYKCRNRDTAWFSILDHEWPRMKAAFEAWLKPENFKENGKQIKHLSDLIPADVSHQSRLDHY
jgi:RimJ/RimL family protein N-acetyltransferase